MYEIMLDLYTIDLYTAKPGDQSLAIGGRIASRACGSKLRSPADGRLHMLPVNSVQPRVLESHVREGDDQKTNLVGVRMTG